MSASTQRDKLDPQSREGLEAALSVMPGGFNAIPDIHERRKAVSDLIAAATAGIPPNPAVSSKSHYAPGPEAGQQLEVRIFRPTAADGVIPGLLYIHAGGMIMGSIDSEVQSCIMLAEQLGVAVASIDYRKAPEHPYPAQQEDCYAAASWVFDNAADLKIDVGNIGIFGSSAGGCLTIALALMARDRKGPQFKYMMPIYPMLDDRNVTPSSKEITDVGIWDRAGALEAWDWYLAGQNADQYAAPARAEDLSGLPPTYIDVGQMDMFRDENAEFVMRLSQAGVPTEFHLYPGAFHASENFAPMAELSQRIWAGRLGALQRFIAAAKV